MRHPTTTPTTHQSGSTLNRTSVALTLLALGLLLLLALMQG